MSEHQHHYRKLNADAVFCDGCGDIKHADPPVCTLPHYAYPVYPIYPTLPRYWWGTTTIGTIPAGTTITYGDTTTLDANDNVTWT